jgi:hypothetical protein
MDWCRRVLLMGTLLCALTAMPLTVAAQVWDPTAAVSAYSAALNAHDMPAALALFDQYGSATDAAGHHFEGSAGLSEFLLSNGFNNPDARITTEGLQIVANRAVWTYSCSCATRSTEVRLVLNHNKISVFAVVAPPASVQPRSGAGSLLWFVGLGLVAGTVAGGLGLWRRRTAGVTARHDQGKGQGRLLAALLQSRNQADRRRTP